VKLQWGISLSPTDC